jgi:hypothetical protein
MITLFTSVQKANPKAKSSLKKYVMELFGETKAPNKGAIFYGKKDNKRRSRINGRRKTSQVKKGQLDVKNFQ